jgi:dTDP-4-dehydrorhamnose reductase
MRILIFGRNGQVASELARYPYPEGVDVLQLSRDDCDVEDFRMTALAVRHSAANVIINATSYSDLGKAETDRDHARLVNAVAPGGIAKAASELVDCPFIHISTADVFDGAKPDPYREDDRVGPLSTFGRTKEAGERAVRKVHDRHVILRTSWVFGAGGAGFVNETLRQARAGSEVRAICDQRGCPTSARDVARACVRIAVAATAGQGKWGTFHYCGAEPTTWQDFAQAIVDEAWPGPGNKPAVVPVTSAESGAAGKRPPNAVLDCGLIRADYGIEQPDWRPGLKAVVKELRAEQFA